MKLKVVVVDLELNHTQKRVASGVAAALLIATAGIALGGPLVTFTPGETLKASDLNGNFSALDGRVTTLEGMTLPDVKDSGGNVGIGTTTPQGKLDVQGFGRTISSAFNVRSVAEFGGGSASNNAILFNTGATAGTASIRGFSIGSASQAFSIARFDSAGTAPPTFDLNVDNNGHVGIGTGQAATIGVLNVAGYGGWSSSNYGAELIVSPAAANTNFPSIGILDQNGANPWAMTNVGGEIRFSQMPAVGDGTSGNTQRVVFASNGNVGIGVGAPAYALDVAGQVRASNVSVTSDARLKTHVRAIDHALDDVERLHGVRFDWKSDGSPSIGVMAQEVEAVYPELVSTAPDGMKSVDYMKLSAVLIESTKELRRQNAALEARMERLEGRMSKASNP